MANDAKNKDATPATESFRRAVWAVVRRIPKGRVTTYGQVAKLAGRPQAARAAGAALAALEGPLAQQVPWHRVVASGGRLATRRDEGPELQRTILEREGVRFSRAGVIDLKRYGWKPPASRASKERPPGPPKKIRPGSRRVITFPR